MQLMPIWFILLFATNLSEDHTKKFTLFHKNGSVVNTYEMTRSLDTRWTMNWLNQPEKIKNAEMHYQVIEKTVLRSTTGERVSIDDLCNVKKTDWTQTTEIEMKRKAIATGQTSIFVNRTERGFSLKQEKGILQDETINVTWAD
jgi:hypothetical protein